MKTYEAPNLRVDGALSSHTLALNPGDRQDLTIQALSVADIGLRGPDQDAGTIGIKVPDDGGVISVSLS